MKFQERVRQTGAADPIAQRSTSALTLVSLAHGIYTATFLAGAFWSPAVGYLSEWLGLTVAFSAMAASFILASACVLFGRFHRITVADGHSAIAHSHH